jgi:hypothetical protein
VSEVACKLDAAGLGDRQRLLAGLIARASHRRELEDGFAFGFAPGAVGLAELAAVVEPDRRCCPFLRIELTAEPEDGPLHLALIGPGETKNFLRALLGIG